MKERNQNKEILRIHPGLSPFVKKDFLILSAYYPVKKLQYVTSKKLFRNMVSQFLLILKIIPRITKTFVFFIWFADYHSFLPVFFSRVFGKKSIIVFTLRIIVIFSVFYNKNLLYCKIFADVVKFLTYYILH